MQGDFSAGVGYSNLDRLVPARLYTDLKLKSGGLSPLDSDGSGHFLNSLHARLRLASIRCVA